MGFDAQDKEIVRLLTKLKDTDGKYPPDLLATRRQHYLRQMGEIGMGVGLGAAIKNAARAGKAPTLSSATSTVLESALVAAIVAETGTVAYFYRDKLAEVVQTVVQGSQVQKITPEPAHVQQEVQGIPPSSAVTATLPSVTLSSSPTEPEPSGTPIPDVVQNNSMNAQSTVSPNHQNVNNGNHYGQTPKPQRTKEPKGNNNQPPKDNSKPTKTK